MESAKYEMFTFQWIGLENKSFGLHYIHMFITSDFFSFALGLMAFLAINYTIFSLGGYWFFYRYLGPTISHREIVSEKPSERQMAAEKTRSLHTQIIFFLVGLVLYLLYQNGLTKIYYEWDQRGVFYFFLSYFLMHQIHDAYFYWTHRLMHEWKFLRKFHSVHHESTPPTPFGGGR